MLGHCCQPPPSSRLPLSGRCLLADLSQVLPIEVGRFAEGNMTMSVANQRKENFRPWASRLRTCAALLLCLPIATVAAEREPPSDALEAAVLDNFSGRMVALPVLSFPRVPEQFLQYAFEKRMEWRDTPLAQGCDIGGSDHGACFIPEKTVVKIHHMRFVPHVWFDSNGDKYRTASGGLFEKPGGSAIGLDLGPADVNEHYREGRVVLLSDPRGFPDRRTIKEDEWSSWPELAKELHRWAAAQRKNCEQVRACMRAVDDLATPGRLRGEAREYIFPDGRKLQYLAATAKSNSSHGHSIKHPHLDTDDMQPNTLHVDLWRVVMPDGATRILRLETANPDDNYWLSGAALVDSPECESQCSGGWSGLPDVFTFHGRTFVFGADWRGTTFGFIFLEVVQTELMYIGAYSWGS